MTDSRDYAIGIIIYRIITGTSGATSRSSPEPPPAAVVHGILKRKLSLGNSSPDQCIVAGAVSSILKKSAGASSSRHGSLEDLTSGSNPPPDGIKSILKKRHQNSTDDELEQVIYFQKCNLTSFFLNHYLSQDQELPRSILKSRRSEESLSPLSDDCVPMIPSGGAGASGSMTGMSVFRKKGFMLYARHSFIAIKNNYCK